MSRLGSRFLVASSVVVVLAYAGLAVAYCFSPVFFDHVEANVPATAWYHLQGHPLYHTPDAVERYNLPYGPCLYLAVGAAQRCLGPSIPASKLPGVVSLLLGLAGLLWLLGRTVPLSQAIQYVAWLVIVLQLYKAEGYWCRPEPLLFLAVTAALFLAQAPTLVSAVLVGVLAGLSVNCKVHSLLYFFPLLVLGRWSRAGVVVLLVTAAGCCVLPFVVVPQVSVVNYLTFLHMVSGHGLYWYKFVGVVLFLILLAAPLLLADFCRGQSLAATGRRLVSAAPLPVVATGVCLLLLLIPASKHGAGPHHLFPLVPILLLLAARAQAQAGPSAVAAPPGFLVLLLPLVLALTVGSWMVADKLPWEPSLPDQMRAGWEGLEDIRHVLSERGDSAVVLMGVGDREHLTETLVRCELVFQGMPIGIDPGSLMDYAFAGQGDIDLDRLERLLGGGKPLVWLIPRGTEPFSLRTYYLPEGPLFTPAFREAFLRSYHKTDSLTQFDVWEKR
jgi:hypothetical protein